MSADRLACTLALFVTFLARKRAGSRSAPLGRFAGNCDDTVLVRKLVGRRWSSIGCRSAITD